jgi:hypothetical protein
MEITQLQEACDLLRRYDGKEPEWARTTTLELGRTQAKHPGVQEVDQAAEAAIGTVKKIIH